MAWQYGEKSHEAGGLPFVYLLKTLIIILPSLLIIQAISNVLSSLFNIPLSTNTLAANNDITEGNS